MAAFRPLKGWRRRKETKKVATNNAARILGITTFLGSLSVLYLDPSRILWKEVFRPLQKMVELPAAAASALQPTSETLSTVGC